MEAEELDMQVMEIFRRVLSAEHPSTLTNMVILAFTWQEEGRVAEAVMLLEEYVQLRTLISGANHSNTLSSSTALMGWETERLKVD
jgi:cytochrome c-type biogenesis protein CcmH/NrfG